MSVGKKNQNKKIAVIKIQPWRRKYGGEEGVGIQYIHNLPCSHETKIVLSLYSTQMFAYSNYLKCSQ